MAILQIPIAKAGKGVTFAVDTDVFNELMADNPEAAMRIVEEGFKAILNSRMSKLAAPSKLEGADYEANKAAALAKAEENLDDLKAGKLVKRASTAKATGVDRAVMTKAVQLARDVIRGELRKAGVKISHVAPREITEYAKQQVAENPKYIEDAKALIAEAAEIKPSVDIASVIKLDPKRVAKAEKEKAARKEERQLSAKQAGIVGKRGKAPPRRPQEQTAH